MRPPTRNDGAVPTIRKHPPLPQPPPQQQPTTRDNQQLLLNSSGSVDSSANGSAAASTVVVSSDKGRRAFFNVASDHLLCYDPYNVTGVPDAAAVSDAGAAYKLVSYERRHSNTDDFSPQVSFSSSVPQADVSVVCDANDDDGKDTNAPSYVVDSDDSSSANNCMLYATSYRECVPDIAEQQPLWVEQPAANARRQSISVGASSWHSNFNTDQLKRKRVSIAAAPTVDADRVALVKNSASLIFTKKSVGGGSNGNDTGHPVVHRRQRDSLSSGGGGGARAAENRRSLHDQQEKRTSVRAERAYSWYAPLYTPLREEGEYRLLQNSTSPQYQRSVDHRQQSSTNLASLNAAGADTHGSSESDALLGLLSPPGATGAIVGRNAAGAIPPSTLHLQPSHPPEGVHAYAKRQFSMSPNGGVDGGTSSVSAVNGATPAASTTTPKYSRFEQLIKSLVGRKVSREVGAHSAATAATMTPSPATPIQQQPVSSTAAILPAVGGTPTAPSAVYPMPSPEIRITKSPSEYSLLGVVAENNGAGLVDRAAHRSSTASLNAAVQQKLWSVVPLLTRRDAGSCASLSHAGGGGRTLMKKCDTVLALSRASSTHLEPAMSTAVASASVTATAYVVRPQNRLRNSSSSTITCSRCSSLLSLAANGSRYSLNVSQGGGFVAIGGAAGADGVDACVGGSSTLSTPMSETADQPTAGSRSSLLASAGPMATTTAAPLVAAIPVAWTCKLCLGEVPTSKMSIIMHCGCVFCTECMMAYVEFEILEGAYEISCPDALCPVQGALSTVEIARLSSSSLLDKHQRYRLNREVDLDKSRTWCPKAGCDTVCRVTTGDQAAGIADRGVVVVQPLGVGVAGVVGLLGAVGPCLVNCPTCSEQFCSGCKKTWHPTNTCEENTRRLAAEGQSENIGIPFDNDLIKCCPTCSVPIEKDEGCAQMMCKRCKHVFCWYCLTSLDDDFLLRHYDRGPCKNKLGHSRASVVWHRAQVIGIFAGFGILLLVASPLLLLAAPCIVCCKCRICNTNGNKLEESGADADFEEISSRNR